MSAVWIALRRPLFVTFILGCTISLMTTGRLILTLVAGSMIGWSFVPIAELAGFFVAVRSAEASRSSGDSGARGFSRAALLDRFFAGHGPWTAFVVVAGAVAAALPPWHMNIWSGPYMTALEIAGIGVAIRSWFIDVEFYRAALGRSHRDAVRDALIQRAVSWPAAAAYFGGYAAWPLVTNVLSR